MNKKRTDKKILALESFFEPILICNNKKLKPHSEILIQEAENMTQKNLGTLVGVFEMTETSEESSYIANYIISVLKKEYFSNPKRAPLESFEAALHKGNLALSKLAEHGHVKWIGKLNAIVAIFEKNNLHLSQVGTASAFLLRGKTLTDISEGLASSESQHSPLKTFVNISSGRMENGDRLIITTEGIFDIFSSEELKKNALRFSYEEFVRFLKTALGNELERAAVLVADIQEKKEAEPKKETPVRERFNAFSQASFAKPGPAVSDQKLTEEIRREPAASSPQKNGHIYIKESEAFAEPKKSISDYWKTVSDHLSALKTKTASSLKSSLKKQLGMRAKNLAARMPKVSAELPLSRLAENTGKLLQAVKNIFLRILPSMARLKKSLANLDPQQRKYALAAAFMIFFLPLIFLQAQNYIQEKNKPAPAPITAPLPVPLEQDKNVVRLENLNQIFTDQNLSGLIYLNGKIFAVSQKEITDLSSRQTYAIPADFGKIELTAGMNDLNLIFIINEGNNILSFSPTSRKFQTNNISAPDGARLIASQSYLTYLYLLDAANNQIYRYPRAEGGFGEKINWLKEAVDLSQAKDMLVGENIFIADGQKILKFFRGKKQELALEESATPILAAKIFASGNGTIYALDRENSRIAKWDANGNIVAQYYHARFKDFNDLVIDEPNNLIYLSDSNSVISFSMN